MSWRIASRLVLALGLCGCRILHGGPIEIQAARHRVVASSDGAILTAYELRAKGDGRPIDAHRAILFFVQGSVSRSVLDMTGRLAGATALGALVVVVERREVAADGTVDAKARARYSTREQRVSDHLSVIDDYLARLRAPIPVIVMGGSEGGIIAAELAHRRARITHLVLIASGCGWTQAHEFRHFLRKDGSYLGIKTEPEFDDQLERIRRDPLAIQKEWAGHTFRHWSSYLWYSPLRTLLDLDIPILLVQGGRDESVPVESARAVQKAFVAAGKKNLTYREHQDLDHTLIDSKGRQAFPLVEIDIVAWLAQTGVLKQKEEKTFLRRVQLNHPELFEKSK